MIIFTFIITLNLAAAAGVEAELPQGGGGAVERQAGALHLALPPPQHQLLPDRRDPAMSNGTSDHYTLGLLIAGSSLQ